jgi:hypothetical protein
VSDAGQRKVKTANNFMILSQYGIIGKVDLSAGRHNFNIVGSH